MNIKVEVIIRSSDKSMYLCHHMCPYIRHTDTIGYHDCVLTGEPKRLKGQFDPERQLKCVKGQVE